MSVQTQLNAQPVFKIFSSRPMEHANLLVLLDILGIMLPNYVFYVHPIVMSVAMPVYVQHVQLDMHWKLMANAGYHVLLMPIEIWYH